MLTVPCIYYNWRDQAHAELIRGMLVHALEGQAEAIKWIKGILNYRSGR
jgi:hypothetical protein